MVRDDNQGFHLPEVKMRRVRTAEFSVEAIEAFDDVSVQGSATGFRRDPDELFSPTLSLWTMDADPHVDMATYLARCQEGQGDLVERRALTVAGMTGVYGESVDTLEDYETGHIKDWHRLRALLAGTDRSTWYHCTAMATPAFVVRASSGAMIAHSRSVQSLA